jgi:hypothetical protein
MKNAEATENRFGEQQTVAIDWAETEWFQVWLRLARRDYQGESERGPGDPRQSLRAAA